MAIMGRALEQASSIRVYLFFELPGTNILPAGAGDAW